jgi:hypothetical protein
LSPDSQQFAFNFSRAGVINVATVGVAGGDPLYNPDESKNVVENKP